MKGQLEEILGKGRYLRGWAPFETERGEGALLVLYATDVVEPPIDAEPPATPTCAEQVTGLPVVGRYFVALVVRGALVNTIELPADGPLAFPLSNRPELNARYYGQDAGIDPESAQTTRLVKLADFTGDGNAWEFRLVRGDCRHLETLLAGYSPRARRAIVFPILRGSERRVWADDFFPPPTTPAARRVTIRSTCAEGAEAAKEKYAYDARREAWVLARSRHATCPQPASVPGDRFDRA
jgi:hypothetical protein